MQVLRLLGNRVLVRPVDQIPGETPNSTIRIHLPLNVRGARKNPYGVVVMLGNGRGIPPEIREGGLVRLDVKFGSVDVTHEGVPHRIVSSLDVQCVFEENGHAPQQG